MPRRPAAYDEDDFDDGYDDYEEYEEYEEEEEQGGEGRDQSDSKPESSSQTKDSNATLKGQGLSAGNGPGATSVQREDTAWRCPACTFDNHPSVAECEICGTSRPGAGQKQAVQITSQSGSRGTVASAPRSALANLLCTTPHPCTAQGSATKRATAGRIIPGKNKTIPMQSFERALYGPQYGSIEAFPFNTPSPDDKARATQSAGVSRPEKPASALNTGPSGFRPPSSEPNSSATKPADTTSASSSGKKQADLTKSSKGGKEVERGLGVQGAELGLRGLQLESGDAERTVPPFGDREGAAGPAREGARKRDGAALKGKPLEEYKPESWIAEARRAEQKATLHLVVIGHVDAGKSTLTGHLLHSMGFVSQKEMHKNRREATDKGKSSFAFAWVLDEGSEERARGVTMTLAVAQMDTEKLHVKLLDAPGHRDFVPSMISGASQADAAILVIDSSPGALESGLEGTAGRAEKGQTWEHMQLARSAGVEQLIVAVNKMDALEYSQDAFEGIKKRLLPVLKQSGFKEASLQFIPLSGLEGENLDKRAECPSLKSWYTGKSLLEAIDSLSPPSRDLTHPFRMPVSEVVTGRRTLGPSAVSGKVEAGGMKPGLKVLVMPGGHSATVKALEVGGEMVKVAVAGQSLDVGLSGVEANVLFPGVVLCHPEFPVPEVRRFEARVLTLQAPVPLLRGSQVVLYAHSLKEPATISQLVSLLDQKTGKVSKLRPRAIPSNSPAIIEVTMERSACLEAFTDYRALGRIALRDGGTTVAVGIITKLLPNPYP